MKYLFGPVNSRRLGLSLGVDLVPFKTCTLNCIYCECGATTHLVSEIKEYVPIDDVLLELDHFLADEPELEVITFSGSGEPTLHSGIGDIIEYIKINHPLYPISVLTNGTLLWKESVRKSLMLADFVVPSLDSVTPSVFKRLLRPHKDVTPERAAEGLIKFSNEFDGLIYLEIFIVPGINDSKEELSEIKDLCMKIRHDDIQLNTLDRPPAEVGVEPAGSESLQSIKKFLEPLNVSIVGLPSESEFTASAIESIQDAVLSTLKRRPSTIEDLHMTLGINTGDLEDVLAKLINDGVVCIETLDRGEFYKVL